MTDIFVPWFTPKGKARRARIRRKKAKQKKYNREPTRKLKRVVAIHHIETWLRFCEAYMIFAVLSAILQATVGTRLPGMISP